LTWYGRYVRCTKESALPVDIAAALGNAFAAAQFPGVVAVYLFGSHAEGRAHRESDIDVGVLLRHLAYPSAAMRFDERVRLCAWLVGALHANNVDLVVLNDAPPLLARRIVTHGQRAFCRDPEAAHTFVRDVQLRAADLEPFLRRARRTTLAALTP